MLETCVVLTGLHEERWEDPELRCMLVDKELSVIAPGENEEERLDHNSSNWNFLPLFDVPYMSL